MVVLPCLYLIPSRCCGQPVAGARSRVPEDGCALDPARVPPAVPTNRPSSA